MKQLSNYVFGDDFILSLSLEGRFLPNPYYDYPYVIIEDFLSPENCSAIAAATRLDEDVEEAQIKRMHLGVVQPETNERIRKTVIHTLDPLYEELYRQAFALHQPAIESFFNIALTTATTIQALEYTQGSFYIKHADDSNELQNDSGETVGFIQTAPQRKLSTVLFATSFSDNPNDDSFHGGELRFNYLFDDQGKPITLRPKAGTLVAFPSHPVYSHEVLPVKAGYRLTLVQWHNAIVS